METSRSRYDDFVRELPAELVLQQPPVSKNNRFFQKPATSPFVLSVDSPTNGGVERSKSPSFADNIRSNMRNFDNSNINNGNKNIYTTNTATPLSSQQPTNVRPPVPVPRLPTGINTTLASVPKVSFPNVASPTETRSSNSNSHHHPYIQEASPVAGNNSTFNTSKLESSMDKTTLYPVYPIEVKDISTSLDPINEFSSVYSRVIDDKNFTPSLQLKWTILLLSSAFNQRFTGKYTINATTLPRSLTPEEQKNNQKTLIDHAFRVLSKLVSLNYSEALYLSGTLYDHTPDPIFKLPKQIISIVPKNDIKAKNFFQRAAENGYHRASYKSGLRYELDHGSTDSESEIDRYNKAIKWYLKSGAMGYWKIGLSYENGQCGLPVNSIASIHWYKKAIDQFSSVNNSNTISGGFANNNELGIRLSMLGLSRWYFSGIPGILKNNYQQAFEWAYKSCQNIFDESIERSGQCEYVLGCYFEKGIGCTLSLNKSKCCFENSMKLEYEKASTKLH